jgi:hypothetical protein
MTPLAPVGDHDAGGDASYLNAGPSGIGGAVTAYESAAAQALKLLVLSAPRYIAVRSGRRWRHLTANQMEVLAPQLAA